MSVRDNAVTLRRKIKRGLYTLSLLLTFNCTDRNYAVKTVRLKKNEKRRSLKFWRSSAWVYIRNSLKICLRSPNLSMCSGTFRCYVCTYHLPGEQYVWLVHFCTKRSWFSKLLKNALSVLYRAAESLWKVKFKNYSDITKKAAAYEILDQKSHETKRDSAVKTIDDVRSPYRSEHEETVASNKSGASINCRHYVCGWMFAAPARSRIELFGLA